MDHESLLRCARTSLNNALNDRTARTRELVPQIAETSRDHTAAIATIALEWLEQTKAKIENLYLESKIWSSSRDPVSAEAPPAL